LLDFFRKRREKKRIRKTFREYGSHIESYDLPVEGRVDFALWDNPLEAEKQVTQAHVDFYKRLAPRGSMAIDIGAHIGDTARDLLAGCRPSVIAECFKTLAKRERFDLFDLFAGIDYEMYRVAEFSAGSAPEKIGRREDMKKWPHFDFLAIPSEKSRQILGGPVD
jgi:hypothetical protein